MQKLTVIAQDPSFKVGRRILRASIEVPQQLLGPGPASHRIRVIDYDASSDRHYRPRTPTTKDPFAARTDAQLLADLQYHGWKEPGMSVAGRTGAPNAVSVCRKEHPERGV